MKLTEANKNGFKVILIAIIGLACLFGLGRIMVEAGEPWETIIIIIWFVILFLPILVGIYKSLTKKRK